jgi:hypothetical protein
MGSKRGRGGTAGNKFRLSVGLPVAATMNCADNTGAKNLYIISVVGWGSKLNRYPSGGPGDMVMASVKKGKPDLRKKGKYSAPQWIFVALACRVVYEGRWRGNRAAALPQRIRRCYISSSGFAGSVAVPSKRYPAAERLLAARCHLGPCWLSASSRSSASQPRYADGDIVACHSDPRGDHPPAQALEEERGHLHLLRGQRGCDCQPQGRDEG